MPQTPLQKRITCKVCGAEFYPNKKLQIAKEKLLLAEGVDVHRFLIYACEAYERSDIQVINFRGNDDLRNFLKTLNTFEDLSRIKTLVIARDAETNVTSAIDSVKAALREIELPIPSEPFRFHQDNGIKTAFMLFPGPGQDGQFQTGTIEDLCLATVLGDPLLNCVNTFIECAEQNQTEGDRLKHPWKSKLYAYLAGKNNHAGKRLSQAARDKVWDWEHDSMISVQEIIKGM